MQQDQYERTVQLLNKTNQFNTNTVRMDMAQFLKYVEDESNGVYVANVSDKYGDSGLVAIMLTHQENETLCVQNFLMSCRVMGRQIENSIAFAVEKQAEACGIKRITSSYKVSAKISRLKSSGTDLALHLFRKKMKKDMNSCCPTKMSR